MTYNKNCEVSIIMYEKYTRQALPDKDYRELLGSAICVFNSNNAFIIENILRMNPYDYSWYDLMDKTSGALLNDIKSLVSNSVGDDIAVLFSDLVDERNRIVHSFQITSNGGEQVLVTKTKEKDGNIQFCITKEYLLDFIIKNERLSDLLYELREY